MYACSEFSKPNIRGFQMPDATIVGKITPDGYLHVIYHTQTVDGELYPPYDIVIGPDDENGTVSFKLPQGVVAGIDFYPIVGGYKEKGITTLIPMVERIALSDLLK